MITLFNLFDLCSANDKITVCSTEASAYKRDFVESNLT